MTAEEQDSTVWIPVLIHGGGGWTYALVDAADAEWANQWHWYLNHGYAKRGTRSHGKSLHFSLHRELLGLQPGDGLVVDHINRDRLDNRRTNLRVIPKRANNQNTSGKRNSSSRFRGVSWCAERQKWAASMKVGDRRFRLGRFDNEEEAAAAVSDARKRLMPFAVD